MIPFPEVRLAGRAGGGCDDVVQHLPQWRDVGFVDLVVKRLAICGKLGLQDSGHPLLQRLPTGFRNDFPPKQTIAATSRAGHSDRDEGKGDSWATAHFSRMIACWHL